VVPQAVRVTLGSVAPQAPPERREIPARTVPPVPTAPQVLRVWPVSVVSWVCLDSAAREVSLACLDLPVSLASRELPVGVEIADHPGLSDPLA